VSRGPLYGKISFFLKTLFFYHLRIMSKSFRLSSKNFAKRLSKFHPTCLGERYREKIALKFSDWIFLSLSNIRQNCSRFFSNRCFWPGVRTAFCVTRGPLCCKISIVRKLSFLHHFRTLSEYLLAFWRNQFDDIVKIPFYVLRGTFPRENCSWKVYSTSLS